MVTGTPGGEPAAKTGWARWRGPALFASVCLNLFLVGLMIGGKLSPFHRPHWFGGPPPHARMAEAPPVPGQGMRPGAPGRGAGPGREGGPGPYLSFRQAVQSLPEADRRVFEEAMEAARADIQQGQRALRQARQRVGETVRAEPFDRQAMLDALKDMRDRQTAIQMRLHSGTADALSKLTPDMRRQFADNLTRGRP